MERASLEASGLLQQVGSFASDSFPAPVVRDYNTAFQGGAADNGASLQGVSFAPTQLAVALELPFLGKTSYYLQPERSLRRRRGRGYHGGGNRLRRGGGHDGKRPGPPAGPGFPRRHRRRGELRPPTRCPAPSPGCTRGRTR